MMSDLEHSHHFSQAEKELEKADRMYNFTLSRLESQPKVKVVSKTSPYYRTVKSPDYNSYRYKEESLRDVFTSLANTTSPLNKFQTKAQNTKREPNRLFNNRLTVQIPKKKNMIYQG